MQEYITRELKYELSPDELLSYSRQLAKNQQDKGEAESGKKSVVADYNDKIARLNSEIQILSRKVANGYEHRPIKCRCVKRFGGCLGERTIIAIDPSIVSAGYAVYTDGKLVLSGVIRTPDLPDHERVAHVMQKVWSIALKYPSVSLIIEVPDSFSYARSQRNGKSLNQGSLQKLNWVIGGLFALPSVWANAGTIHSVTPRQWKGSRSKHLDQLATGIKQKDEADAVALGLWWCRIGRKI